MNFRESEKHNLVERKFHKIGNFIGLINFLSKQVRKDIEKWGGNTV